MSSSLLLRSSLRSRPLTSTTLNFASSFSFDTTATNQPTPFFTNKSQRNFSSLPPPNPTDPSSILDSLAFAFFKYDATNQQSAMAAKAAASPTILSTSWWNGKTDAVAVPVGEKDMSTQGDVLQSSTPPTPTPTPPTPSTEPMPSYTDPNSSQNFDLSIPTPTANALESATPAFLELGNYPADYAISLIENIHISLDLPYWQSIALCTVVVRTMLFPLAVMTMRNSSRVAHMKPEMEVLQERMKSDPNMASDTDTQRRYKAQMQALFAKYGCNPFRSLIFPLAQMPLFISFFFGLKKMPEYIDISSGGAFFFTDLSIPDATLALPIMTAATFLIMLEIGADGMQTMQGDQKKMMQMVFRGMGLFMIPMTMHMPQSVFMYWVTNNCFSLTQTLVLKNNTLKRELGIWDPPKEVESTGITDVHGNKLSGKDGDLRKSWKEIMANAAKAAEIRAGIPQEGEEGEVSKGGKRSHRDRDRRR